MDLGGWLRKLGLEHYEAVFRDNEIDDTVLPNLTAEDLKELGVGFVGHRRKLLDAIAALRAGASAPTPLSDAPPATDEAATDTAERRQVTVMFSDLVGSTALSARMDLEDLREVISAYQTSVAETVRRFGGFVARYMGDGVLIYFGYPAAHEDDAERAVQAGLALIDAVAALPAPEPLQVRIGVATGMVVVGDLLGAGEAQEHDIVGETPNLAARLQAIAEPNTVVIAEATHRLLGSLFELQDLGPKDLKGIAGPVESFAVLRASSVESRFEAMHPGVLTALVGREEELELLLRRWAKAKTGEGQVVLLSGEAGIGKSRLAAALMEEIAAEPLTRRRYFCSPQHTDSALYPIIGQFERAAGFAHGDTPQTKLDKLDALLAQTSPSRQDAALFAELLSLPDDGRYPALELAPEQRRQKTLEALDLQLETLARSSPVLTIVEDAHWGDPTSLEAFGRRVDRIANLPVLLIVTFRPEFEAPWVGQPHVTALALNRLEHRNVDTMIDRVIGNKLLPANIRKDIIDRTDGIPLFVEEMTKAVLEAGGELEAIQTAAAVPLPAHPVPASLQASLMARLDRLGPAKELAQIGAAIGREFSHVLLAAVVRKPEADLAASLNRLIRAGLLFRKGVPPHATYLFKHALVQDAAYGTLLRVRRQALHERIAKYLEQQYPELVETQPELLAHHLTEAGLAEPAIDFWYKAGERALRRSANAEAVKHLTRGIELTQSMPTSAKCIGKELDLQLALGPAFLATKGNGAPETLRVYLRARDLLGEGGTHTQRMRVNWGLWNIHYRRAELKAALGVAEEYLVRATHQGYGEARANRLMGQSLCVMGALANARRHLQRTVDLCIANRDDSTESLILSDNQVGALSFLGRTLWPLGFLEQATAAVAKAVSLSGSLRHAYTTAVALYSGLRLEVFGWTDPQREGNYADELLAHCLEHKLLDFENSARFYQGAILARRGDPKHGVEIMRDCMERAEKVGSNIHLPKRLGYLATAYADLGQHEVSLALLDEAIRAVETTSERLFESELYRLRGELFLILGRRREAESALERAMMIARQQEARLWELHAAMSMARLWHEQGKRDEARELLAPVYGWFTEGFDTLDLEQAKALLDELAA